MTKTVEAKHVICQRCGGSYPYNDKANHKCLKKRPYADRFMGNVVASPQTLAKADFS